MIFSPIRASVSSLERRKLLIFLLLFLVLNCLSLFRGSVVTEEAVAKIIRKDMIDPINGKPLKESDLIPLQRGGTGYSSANDLVAKVAKPVMMA